MTVSPTARYIGYCVLRLWFPSPVLICTDSLGRRRTKEMISPVSDLPACHLFNRAGADLPDSVDHRGPAPYSCNPD